VTAAPTPTAATIAMGVSRLDSTRAIVTASPRRRKTCATAIATIRRDTAGKRTPTVATRAATEPAKTIAQRIARGSSRVTTTPTALAASTPRGPATGAAGIGLL